ncbi:MAG: helix-turn-helix transcriptional regulator [Clostridia bacterium]|nr:helix-turn-helix transcriptional regulator [Clostridia bacterium]
MQRMVQSVCHSSHLLNKDPHFHDCHQIIFIVKGTVDFCVNGKTLRAVAGDIAIFSRYENHSVSGCSDEYERFVLHINPFVVNRKSPVYSLLTDRPVEFCNIINVSSYMAEITNMFNRILTEHNSGSKLSDEMEQLLIKQLLITVYRCTTINLDNTYDDVVARIKRQFENEYGEPFTLATLAKQHSISISSLSHRFRAATGISVMEYLQSCRMANAKQMLAETDRSIGEIVEKCGFSDNSNFSRAFRKLTNMSPSDFRKKYKAE